MKTQRPYCPIALVLLVLHLSACASWQPVTVSPRQFIEEGQPQNIRVTRANRTVVRVEDPLIRNDSIAGLYCGAEGVCTPNRGLVSLNDVIGVEVRSSNVAGTWTAIGVGAAALLLVVAAASASGFGN